MYYQGLIKPDGHMGRKKTTQRILARFYWPNVFKDAAEICRTCKEWGFALLSPSLHIIIS